MLKAPNKRILRSPCCPGLPLVRTLWGRLCRAYPLRVNRFSRRRRNWGLGRAASLPPRWKARRHNGFANCCVPLLESDFDLVVPYYAPRMFQGFLNSSIVYPLTRCLYGKRIHNPFGPDVGVSRRLAQKILGTNRNANAGSSQTHPLASLAPVAVCDNMQICQVHVGARLYPPTDWTNMSSLVAQVLGPIFLEMERSAACWQRTRGSVPVPARGERQPQSQETGTVGFEPHGGNVPVGSSRPSRDMEFGASACNIVGT